MKKFFVIIFISLSSVSIAQKKNFIIEGTAPGLYITHKVAAGESLFSVGRKYNQTPQVIATFNNIATDKSLILGQLIKVPLTAQNIAASDKAETGETLIPLYHVVEKSETLFRISNNASSAMADVKQWNNLATDKIVAGTPLIVAHLKVANKQTQIAKSNAVTSADNNTPTTPAETSQPTEEAKKDEPVVAAVKVEEQKAESLTPATKSEEKKNEPVATTPQPEEKKEEPVTIKPEATPASPSQNDQPASTKIGQKENGQMKDETKKLDLLAPEPETSNEGVFSALYSSDVSQKSLANKAGEAATFKTTSGWQDKKYYVLMNDVTPGTILKISSVDNKFVFAKVLGSMPEMKENKGLLLRLSNAAATYLGMVDAKFPVQVMFYQ